MNSIRPHLKRAFAGVFAFLAASIAHCAQAAEPLVEPPQIDGWWQETGSDGITYYLCASAACGDSSMVSLKASKARTPVSLQDYESRYRKFAERSKGAPGIRDIKVGDARERAVEGVKVLQISREMSWADGSKQYLIEARLFGDGRSFIMISGSSTPELATGNFETFLPRLSKMVAAGSK